MAQKKSSSSKSSNKGKTVKDTNSTRTNKNTKSTTAKSTKAEESTKKQQKQEPEEIINPLNREISIISVFALGILMLIFLFGSGSGIGGYISEFLKGLFGMGAILIPIVLIGGAIYAFLEKETKALRLRIIFATAFVLSVLGLIHCFAMDTAFQASGPGNYINHYFTIGSLSNAGLLGAVVGGLLMVLVGRIAAVIILVVAVLIFLMLLTGISFFNLIKKFRAYLEEIAMESQELYDDYEDDYEEAPLPVKKAERPKKTEYKDIEDVEFLRSQSRYDKRKNEAREEIDKRRQLRPKQSEQRSNKKQDKNYSYDERGKVMTIKLAEREKSNKSHKLSLFTDEFKSELSQTEQMLRSRARQEPRINGVPAGYQKPLEFGHDITINSMPVDTPDPDYIPENVWEQGEVYETIMESAENVRDIRPRTRNIPVIPSEFIPSKDDAGYFDYDDERGFEADKIYFDHDGNIIVDAESDEDYEGYGIDEATELEKPDIDLEAIEESYLHTDDDFKPVYSDYDDEDTQNLMDGYPELPDIGKELLSLEEYYTEEDEVLETKAVKPAKSDKIEAYEEDLPPWENQPIIIEAEKTRTYDKLHTDNIKAEYKFPKLSFLGKNPNINDELSRDEMLKKAKLLEDTLKSFGVEAKVNNISKGPTVTRFELTPSIGTRVNKIVSLEEDMALSLAAKSIRIEAPIPGMSAIGIELPNDNIMSVYFSEILQNEKFQNFNSKLAFGIGKDITGNVIVYDIAKMPHMLVAGATGAGKSVCINTLITSILYKATPDEVKLIMVDPKVVELSVYNGIPHLLIPVVTDPKKASAALNWAVGEMMRRYDLFATTGTRNLEGFNAKQEKQDRLPQIVIIIDELADLMMVAKKNVEEAICRLAQLARAAGIHLIIATQRPSVDVITGIIKANIPSRIAFKVSSSTDSRTILDHGGAEKLLGRGDMLFKAVDMNQALRVQGAFVTDAEVEAIVDYIKVDEGSYDKEVMEQIERAAGAEEQEDVSGSSNGGSDDLMDEVIDFIVKKGKASTSLIQRQFRIGFNKAARIVDELEERGIVGPENGSKPREVLMDKYEWQDYKQRHKDYV